MGLGKRGCPFLFLLRLLFEFAVSVASSGCNTVSVAFSPTSVHKLVMGQNIGVQMTVNCSITNQLDQSDLPTKVILRSIDSETASVIDGLKDLHYMGMDPVSNLTRRYQANFTVKGNLLGKTAICARLPTAQDLSVYNDTSYKETSASCRGSAGKLLDVSVTQEEGRVVDRIFLTMVILLIVISNVLMGCELDLKMVMETLKKPIPPFIGLCTQFIAMPLLAYAIATVVFLSQGLHSFALGLFVTGCSPGGGASNYWTLLLDGNVPVSITMTFISTLAAVVMMPAWMWALGSRFLRGYTGIAIKVPYRNIFSSLFTMIVPLIIGVSLARWKPAVQTKARKVMRPFLIFVLTFLVVFGTIANLYMFKILTWTALLGGLLLPWCGFTVGCFAALFTRQTPQAVTAIAIETGIQNTGISIMLLKFSFPQPDADISSLIPVIAACFTPLPLLFMVGAHEVLKYVKKRRQLIAQDSEAANRLSFEDNKVPVASLVESK